MKHLTPACGGPGPRGRVRKSNVRSHVRRLRSLGLFPQGRRARTLERLISRHSFTKAEFARTLGVTRRVVYSYLDRRNPNLISPAVASRIARMLREAKSAGTAHPLAARFGRASRRLFGTRREFDRWDKARAAAVRRIAAASGLSERTVRRYVPPYDPIDSPPAVAIVEAFEAAARRLSRAA